ncbi:hypothetical protein V6N13_104941 [Hibiscus sabdariffa]
MWISPIAKSRHSSSGFDLIPLAPITEMLGSSMESFFHDRRRSLGILTGLICILMDLIVPLKTIVMAWGWISWYPLQPVDVVATNKEISIYSKLEYCYSFGFHFSKDLGFVCFQLFKIAGDLSVGHPHKE